VKKNCETTVNGYFWINWFGLNNSVAKASAIWRLVGEENATACHIFLIFSFTEFTFIVFLLYFFSTFSLLLLSVQPFLSDCIWLFYSFISNLLLSFFAVSMYYLVPSAFKEPVSTSVQLAVRSLKSVQLYFVQTVKQVSWLVHSHPISRSVLRNVRWVSFSLNMLISSAVSFSHCCHHFWQC
jgi:hypothetical protein